MVIAATFGLAATLTACRATPIYHVTRDYNETEELTLVRANSLPLTEPRLNRTIYVRFVTTADTAPDAYSPVMASFRLYSADGAKPWKDCKRVEAFVDGRILKWKTQLTERNLLTDYRTLALSTDIMTYGGELADIHALESAVVVMSRADLRSFFEAEDVRFRVCGMEALPTDDFDEGLSQMLACISKSAVCPSSRDVAGAGGLPDAPRPPAPTATGETESTESP